MNVLHSRRKREREKVEIAVFNEHVDELRVAREHLINEKHRLHGLLQAAKSQVEMIERGVMEYPPTPSQAAGLSIPDTPKPAVRRLVERPDEQHMIQSNSTSYQGQVGGPSSGQMQHQPQQQQQMQQQQVQQQQVQQHQPQQQQQMQQQSQQHYLFPVGAPQPGSLMMFPHAHVSQGLRLPQEQQQQQQHYVQVQGGQQHYAGDPSATFHYAVQAPAPVAVAPSQQWQPQMLSAAPSHHHHQQQQQLQHHHHQPQIVVQMQPYQPVGYVVAPPIVMSNSGPPTVGGGLSDSTGPGYWVVGGGAPGDQIQQGGPPPM
jgi:hypothetical protein